MLRKKHANSISNLSFINLLFLINTFKIGHLYLQETHTPMQKKKINRKQTTKQTKIFIRIYLASN